MATELVETNRIRDVISRLVSKKDHVADLLAISVIVFTRFSPRMEQNEP